MTRRYVKKNGERLANGIIPVISGKIRKGLAQNIKRRISKMNSYVP